MGKHKSGFWFLVVALLVVMSLLAACKGAEPAPAAFQLSDLSVQPAQVESGKSVTVSVKVSNTGGQSGSYTVTLNLNGVKETDKLVTVAAESSQTVTFTVTKTAAGNYQVAVGNLTGNFTVTTAAPPITAPLIPHTLEGRADCLSCHGSGISGIPQVPANHAGRTNADCATCHKATS